MKEPNISELEKLINHFRKTKREEELKEALSLHGIKNHYTEQAIEPDTHEINPEVLVLEKIKKNSFWEKIKKIWGTVKFYYKEKWYVRYGTYYVFLFLLIFLILNAPIIINSFKGETNSLGGQEIIKYQVLEQQKMEDSAPLDAGEVIPAGSQIVVPKINVSAPIVFPESRDEKIIQNALTQGVVHYAGTVKPGEVGNSFLTGHSSNFWWIKGNYNYIFLNLNKLAIGDQAKIYHGGKKYVYQVKEVIIVEPNDTSVLASSDTPTLTLMTCTPPGTNWKRLIVKLDQIAPKYYKPQIVTKEVISKPKNLPSTDSNSTGGILNEFWSWVKSLTD